MAQRHSGYTLIESETYVTPAWVYDVLSKLLSVGGLTRLIGWLGANSPFANALQPRGFQGDAGGVLRHVAWLTAWLICGLRLGGLARTVSCDPIVCRHRAVRNDVISQLTAMVVILLRMSPATIEQLLSGKGRGSRVLTAHPFHEAFDSFLGVLTRKVFYLGQTFNPTAR